MVKCNAKRILQKETQRFQQKHTYRLTEYVSRFCDHYIRSWINGLNSILQPQTAFSWMDISNWIRTPCKWFLCQILLPGHLLWGNSQHVGCKDHFYTTHSPDRPLILDDFSETQITPVTTFLSICCQHFPLDYSYNICLWQVQYGYGLVRFRQPKLLGLGYGEEVLKK